MTFYDCSTPYIDLDEISCHSILSDAVKLDIFLRYHPDPQICQIVTDFVENLPEGEIHRNYFTLVIDVDKLLHHIQVRMIIKNLGLATAIKLGGQSC